MQAILLGVAQKAQAVAVNIAHAAMALYGAITKTVTGQIKAARYEMIFFNDAIKANPIGLLVTALTFLLPYLYNLWDSSKKVTKAFSEQEQKAKAVADAQKAMADEAIKSSSKFKTAVDPLIALLKDQNTTLDMRKRAYKALVEMYPEFEGTVDSEKRATGKLAEVYETLAKRIKEAAIARGMQKIYTKAADELAEAQLKSYKAKLSKIKEDEYNKKVLARNKNTLKSISTSKRATVGGSMGQATTLEKVKTKANDAFKKALEEEKQKELRLSEIRGLQQKKISEYENKVNDLTAKIKEKSDELNTIKGEKVKKQLQKEIAKLKVEKHSAENALYSLVGIPTSLTTVKNRGGGDDAKPNKQISESHKKIIAERQKTQREALKAQRKLEEERLSQMQDSADKEIALLELQTEKKLIAICNETEKLEQEIGTQNLKLQELTELSKNKKLTTAQRSEIDESIANLRKSIAEKESIIRMNGEREGVIIDASESKKATIQHKWQLKKIEDFKKAENAKITQYLLDSEREISNIESIEEAKAKLQGKLSEKELAAIKTLEDAKTALRKESNNHVIVMQEASLKAQIELMEKMLPEFTGEAADKMTAQLKALYETLNKIKSSLNKPEEKNETSSKSNLEQVDVLGFSAAQWEATFSNLDTMGGKMAAVGMAFSALGNAAQMYAQHQKNLNDRELVKFQQAQTKKKKLLESQLNAGIISQEQYHSQMALMDAKAEAKKQELALKQAKAEKASRMFSIVGDTAKAVASALPNIPLSILVGALGAAQLAIVAGQKLPSYHVGGFTGGLGFRDGSGHEVAGAVHEGEYVIPKWLLKKPEVANVAQWLETKRQGTSTSYDEGGYTSTASVPQENTATPIYVKDDTASIALIQVLHKLSEVLEDIEQKGIDAYVISDAKSGREMAKAIKEFKKIQNKNRR